MTAGGILPNAMGPEKLCSYIFPENLEIPVRKIQVEFVFPVGNNESLGKRLLTSLHHPFQILLLNQVPY